MMNPSANEIAYQLGSFFRAYKDGRVERFFGTDRIPASINSPHGISFKDVQIVQETGVSARVFIPTNTNSGQRLPLLVYFHGGGFLIGSPFCSAYHNCVTSIVTKANIIAISVDYRLAPEHPIPIAYEDSWAALKWIASHCDGGGPESWLNDHADFGRVFLGGDSAGANIAHNMGIQAGVEGLNGVKVLGICLVHPYFGRKESGVDECWTFVSPKTSGFNDLRINPSLDSRLARLGCSKVLIFVAEKDKLKERGVFYYETLRESEWDGEVEIVETEGEEHVFHLFNPSCENAFALLKKFASFINQRLIS
ncbi:probable carboxylesterase 5 [Ricinus communis]|uniref:probable carboxylesterase 5 n=1 Tax=Ricinus communis TaxID=3988 RepID=UPI000772678E|nr:probable carboxylesterase 5 [Ricinus communis]